MDFQNVESSNIDGVYYNSEDQELFVRFKTGLVIYKYHNVAQDVYDQFMNAESKGKYFAASIKNSYTYEKVS